MNTYEESYKDRNHFSFGKNWLNFLKTLNDKKIEEAEKSVEGFFGGRDKVAGKTFVDIGCGSGLFSLAAYRLGAAKVVSVDIDDFSVACAKYLKEKYEGSDCWQIAQGSALNSDFIQSLGKFDLVYSWGVLHHTGNMYEALKNVSRLLSENGMLYLAIYNRFNTSWRGGTSLTWLRIKRIYNNSGVIIKRLMAFVYILYSFIMMFVRFQLPYSYIRNYKNKRGMSWYCDILDWIGGYPYEYASIEEMINFFSENNMYAKKVREADGLGCNEFLFFKK